MMGEIRATVWETQNIIKEYRADQLLIMQKLGIDPTGRHIKYTPKQKNLMRKTSVCFQNSESTGSSKNESRNESYCKTLENFEQA